MRTLRQIPKVVGQTDAGETIYEVRSARLVLRGDAAHFNRLVRCSKCGREVPGRAVLGPADLEQPPQAVVCSDCVEAATEMSQRPGPLAEPVATDEPAVADAQAEMNLEVEVPPGDLGGLGDDEPEEAGDDGLAGAPGGVPPAEEEPPAVNLQLMEDVAGVDGDEPPVDDDEALAAEAAFLDDEPPPAPADEDLAAAPEEDEAPAPADDDLVAALEEESPAPEDEDELFPADAETAPAEVAVDAGPEADEVDEAGEAPAPAPLPLIAVARLGDAEPPATDAFVAVPTVADDGLVRRLDLIEERLDALSAGAGSAGGAGADPLRVAALEETVQRLDELAAAQVERAAALQARLDQLAGAVDAAQGKKETDKLRRRLDQTADRLDQLQGTIDAEWARAKAETATLGQALSALGERVEALAEQAGVTATTAGEDDERLAALEEKVEEVTTDVARALQAQRKELQEGLRSGLADVLSAIPAPAAPAQDVDGRLRAMEKQVRQGRAEVTELNELHAALDAGLGVLRGELGEVRTALGRLADSKADLDDRLETFVRMSLVPDGEKGRKAKKAAESTLGTLSAAVQDLLREQRQLKDAVAGLEQVSDAATAAAARASMQASSLGPLRSDVKLLHQEMTEQQEAVEELRRAVDRLRQAPPPAPAPRPGPPAAKRPATKAAKAPATKAAATKAPAPAAKTATKAPAKSTAKAAIAKAAAAQAAAAKSPAAKKAARAKKA